MTWTVTETHDEDQHALYLQSTLTNLRFVAVVLVFAQKATMDTLKQKKLGEMFSLAVKKVIMNRYRSAELAGHRMDLAT